MTTELVPVSDLAAALDLLRSAERERDALRVTVERIKSLGWADDDCGGHPYCCCPHFDDILAAINGDPVIRDAETNGDNA